MILFAISRFSQEEMEMASISQYWVWILVAVAGYFFLTRMAGCGMGQSMNHGSSNERPSSGHGGDSGVALDPVSRQNVAIGGPSISAVYRGRAY